MSSWNYLFGAAVKLLRSIAYTIPRDIQSIRLLTDNGIPTWCPTLPYGVARKPTIEPFSGEWYYPKEVTVFTDVGIPRHDGVYILYIHGGAFCCCNTETHRGILYRLVSSTNACIFAFDYRRPPEFPFPAPVQDCLGAYKWLLENGIHHSKILFAGDSAGGGLCVTTLLAIAEENLDMPAGAILLSPWVDLSDTSTSDSWIRNAEYDYLPPDLTDLFAKTYKGDAEWEDVSPTYSTKLHLLPPLLVECGAYEVLMDQILKFCAKCLSADVNLEVNVREDMIHVFQLFTFTGMPQCLDSFKSIAAFCSKHVPPRLQTDSK